MLNYIHDDAWRADLESCVNTTVNCLRDLGTGETKEIPSVIAAELEDKTSIFWRFIEVFFDEARLDAELSFGAETEGDPGLMYHDHARKKAVREANLKRCSAILDDAILFCTMSKEYGMDFKFAIRSILTDSFPHQGFLFELYETIMLKTRWRLLDEKKGISRHP